MNWIKFLKEEVVIWFEHFVIIELPGRMGNVFRRSYWGRKFIKSSFFTFAPGCIITAPRNISVGNKVRIMHNCCLYAHNSGIIKIGDRVSINSNVIVGAADNGEIVLGNDVSIGPNVVLRASNHKYERKDVRINQQGHTGGRIIVDDDVWIGANVVILPNVTIGKGAVIAAGAVVNKDIPAYSLAGGVPAKVIRENARCDQDKNEHVL